MPFVKVRPLQESTIKVVGDERKLTVVVPEAIIRDAQLDPAKPVAIEVDVRAKPPLLALIGSDTDAHWPMKKKGRLYEISIQELPAKVRAELPMARFKLSPSKLVINLPEKWELADDMALKA